MQKRNKNQILAWILCMTLTVAMAFGMMGCGGKEEAGAPAGTEAGVQSEGGEVGEGAKQFGFTVTDADGNETDFTVHTDKETVGEALEELGLIEGEEGEYGLYVTTVNGVTVDFDEDGKYWAFYVNGEYAQTGVDVTAIEEGASYMFKVE